MNQIVKNCLHLLVLESTIYGMGNMCRSGVPVRYVLSETENPDVCPCKRMRPIEYLMKKMKAKKNTDIVCVINEQAGTLDPYDRDLFTLINYRSGKSL